MNSTTILFVACLGLCACAQPPLVMRANSMPKADAGPDQSVELASGTAAVTLDGSGSKDQDGSIVAYRWLSAVKRSDGMTGRMVPDGESADWPADEAKPTVNLPMGLWVFTLQVTDDRGASSLADTVTINVGPVPVPVATGGVGAGVAGMMSAGAGGR